MAISPDGKVSKIIEIFIENEPNTEAKIVNIEMNPNYTKSINVN